MADDENETQCLSCHMIFPNKDRLLQHVQAKHFITIDIEEPAEHNVMGAFEPEQTTSLQNNEPDILLPADSGTSISLENQQVEESSHQLDTESTHANDSPEKEPNLNLALCFDQELLENLSQEATFGNQELSSLESTLRDTEHSLQTSPPVPLTLSAHNYSPLTVISEISVSRSSPCFAEKVVPSKKRKSSAVVVIESDEDEADIGNDVNKGSDNTGSLMQQTDISMKEHMYNLNQRLTSIPAVRIKTEKPSQSDSLFRIDTKLQNKLQSIFFINPYPKLKSYNRFGSTVLYLKNQPMKHTVEQWFAEKRNKIKVDYLQRRGIDINHFKEFVKSCKVSAEKVDSIAELTNFALSFKVPMSTIKIWYRVEKFIGKILVNFFLSNPEPSFEDMSAMSSRTNIPCKLVLQWFHQTCRKRKKLDATIMTDKKPSTEQLLSESAVAFLNKLYKRLPNPDPEAMRHIATRVKTSYEKVEAWFLYKSLNHKDFVKEMFRSMQGKMASLLQYFNCIRNELNASHMRSMAHQFGLSLKTIVSWIMLEIQMSSNFSWFYEFYLDFKLDTFGMADRSHNTESCDKCNLKLPQKSKSEETFTRNKNEYLNAVGDMFNSTSTAIFDDDVEKDSVKSQSEIDDTGSMRGSSSNITSLAKSSLKISRQRTISKDDRITVDDNSSTISLGQSSQISKTTISKDSLSEKNIVISESCSILSCDTVTSSKHSAEKPASNKNNVEAISSARVSDVDCHDDFTNDGSSVTSLDRNLKHSKETSAATPDMNEEERWNAILNSAKKTQNGGDIDERSAISKDGNDRNQLKVVDCSVHKSCDQISKHSKASAVDDDEWQAVLASTEPSTINAQIISQLGYEQKEKSVTALSDTWDKIVGNSKDRTKEIETMSCDENACVDDIYAEDVTSTLEAEIELNQLLVKQESGISRQLVLETCTLSKPVQESGTSNRPILNTIDKVPCFTNRCNSNEPSKDLRRKMCVPTTIRQLIDPGPANSTKPLFSTEQRETLQQLYKENPYPTYQQLINIARQLDNDLFRVKIWFDQQRDLQGKPDNSDARFKAHSPSDERILELRSYGFPNNYTNRSSRSSLKFVQNLQAKLMDVLDAETAQKLKILYDKNKYPTPAQIKATAVAYQVDIEKVKTWFYLQRKLELLQKDQQLSSIVQQSNVKKVEKPRKTSSTVKAREETTGLVDIEELKGKRRRRKRNSDDDMDWCDTGSFYNISSESDILSDHMSDNKVHDNKFTTQTEIDDSSKSVTHDDMDSRWLAIVGGDTGVGKSNITIDKGNKPQKIGSENKPSNKDNQSRSSDIMSDNEVESDHVISEFGIISHVSSVISDRRTSHNKVISGARDTLKGTHIAESTISDQNSLENVQFQSTSKRNSPSLKEFDKNCHVLLQRCDQITQQEREKLELYHKKNPDPNPEEIEVITEILGLCPSVIKNWFLLKNRRRGNSWEDHRLKSGNSGGGKEMEFEDMNEYDIADDVTSVISETSSQQSKTAIPCQSRRIIHRHVQPRYNQEQTHATASVSNTVNTTTGTSMTETFQETPLLQNRFMPEDLKLYCSSYPHVYVKKFTKVKGARPYDRVHACCYCGGLFTFIQDHMEKIHRQKEWVKEILDLTKILDEKRGREEDWKKIRVQIASKRKVLRFRGDHYHNQDVMNEKAGELLISKRLVESFDCTLYKKCPSCMQWLLLNKHFSKHRGICSGGIDGKKDDLLIQADILSGQQFKSSKDGLVGSRMLQKEVFPSMKDDGYSYIAKRDQLITSLGDIWLSRCVGQKRRRRNFSSFRMRLAAKFLHLLRIDTGNNYDLSDFLCPKYFDSCVKAAINACKADEIHKTSLKHPSTALKLRYDLNRLGAIKMRLGIRKNNVDLKKEATEFLHLMKKKWSCKVSRRLRVVLDARAINPTNLLPYPNDIQILSSYLQTKLSDVTILNYREVAVNTQAYLLMYNKSHPGEIEELTLEDCQMIQDNLDEVEQPLLAGLTETEKYLVKCQRLVCVRGKGGRGEPILLPQVTKQMLAQLTSLEERSEAGINMDNHYLFADTSDGAMRAGESLRNAVEQVELRGPERITATNFRKYLATVTQVFALNDHELKWVTNHLSQTTKVHENHFRATSGAIDRIQIAKLMMITKSNLLQHFHRKELKDIEFEDIIQHENIETENAVAAERARGNDEMHESDSDVDEGAHNLFPRKKKTTTGYIRLPLHTTEANYSIADTIKTRKRSIQSNKSEKRLRSCSDQKRRSQRLVSDQTDDDTVSLSSNAFSNQDSELKTRSSSNSRNVRRRSVESFQTDKSKQGQIEENMNVKPGIAPKTVRDYINEQDKKSQNDDHSNLDLQIMDTFNIKPESTGDTKETTVIIRQHSLPAKENASLNLLSPGQFLGAAGAQLLQTPIALPSNAQILVSNNGVLQLVNATDELARNMGFISTPVTQSTAEHRTGDTVVSNESRPQFFTLPLLPGTATTAQTTTPTVTSPPRSIATTTAGVSTATGSDVTQNKGEGQKTRKKESASPVYRMKKLIEMFELDPSPTVMEMNIIAKLLELEPSFVKNWFEDMRSSGHSSAVPGVTQPPLQQDIPPGDTGPLQTLPPSTASVTLQQVHGSKSRLTPDSTTPF